MIRSCRKLQERRSAGLEPGSEGARVRRAFWNRVGGIGGQRPSRRKTIQRTGIMFAAGLGLFHLCCPFSIGVVQGSSMLPTYQPGQFFLLDRHYYQNHPVRRGDVVVVRCDSHTMIKRVFGLPGDRIWLLVQRDGDRIDRYIIDTRLLERMRRAAEHWDIGHITQLTVPKGSIYLRGDCTEFSIDSRAFGAVPMSSIVGRVSPLRAVSRPVAVKPAFPPPGSD